MDKSFDPAAVEPRWRQRWEELHVGVADPTSGRRAFVIALPPPNITGVLHLGHATSFSVQDILARYHRMIGDEVEWCPGTDHAAIATQNVIERQLAAEGTTKEELGRERFRERVAAWYEEYGDRILQQMRSLGFTCDWSRTRFTLDPAYVRAIRLVFKTLYDQEQIYRGPRIVNWCPRCLSAISDEEVEWQEHEDHLHYLRYPVDDGSYITIATVRPETMLGDTAVAVSPGDERYARLVGRTVVLPLAARPIPIIEDDAVRRDFGTGALKVTPAHDPMDYDIGHRHSLPSVSVIAPDGTLDVPSLPQFHGMPVLQARQAVMAALREIGAVEKVEPYRHEVGHCDRCGTTLEPLISEQWWVRMRPLAEPAVGLVERGAVRFHPAKPHTEVFLTWMRNIRDWCISRQLWLGHAIPVSTCANGHSFAWVEEPTACTTCGDTALRHDPDVLDTWFSSALWPYAIFGWPETTLELERFYPTDVLVTAREIIFLWVARMMMTGLRFAGDRPFSDVIINSTILAQDGSRMSKSKGNAIDPLVMIEHYGADAVRAWAGAVGTSGQDMRFDEKRLESYRRFANKLYNVTRFLVHRLGDEGGRIAQADPPDPAAMLAEDHWILARTAETIDACDSAIRAYRFHDGLERLYELTWHGYCDWYVELTKPRLREGVDPVSRNAAAWTLTTVLDVLLRLLHPFMPFITEECAEHLPGAAPTLQQRAWPVADAGWREPEILRDAQAVQCVLDFVQRLRAARQEAGIAPTSRQRHALTLGQVTLPLHPGRLAVMLATLAPVDVVDAAPGGGGGIHIVAPGIDATLHTGGQARDQGRISREVAELGAQIDRLQAQLGNVGFVERAPAAVVQDARRRLDAYERQRDTMRAILDPEQA